VIKKKEYSHGTGRRKEAVAQVKLMPGSGSILVNGMPYEERFPRIEHRLAIMKPLVATDTAGKYDATIKVTGGGIAGQAGAIVMGLARALVQEDEKYKLPLRKDGLLSRDPRGKERKKPGLKRARKAPQYTKR
jgi:small subunit ribosomal protein S9